MWVAAELYSLNTCGLGRQTGVGIVMPVAERSRLEGRKLRQPAATLQFGARLLRSVLYAGGRHRIRDSAPAGGRVCPPVVRYDHLSCGCDVYRRHGLRSHYVTQNTAQN